MTGFEFAKTFDTIEEKLLVLFMDAVKTAYAMQGIDFDSFSADEKKTILFDLISKKV